MATKCTQLTDEIKSGRGNYTERNCVSSDASHKG